MNITEMRINGDFRSEDCTTLLKQADIVVTNPPFSLFRDFFKWLMDNDKKFIIIGNMNAISYKEIFPYIKDNKVWSGVKRFGGGMNLIQPQETFDETQTKSYKVIDGQIIKNIMGCIWFTNVEHDKRHEPLLLTCKYNEEDYPKYDNYDAIEVSKVNKIPCDYYGEIGVPITFIGDWNPDQFEIIGLDRYTVPKQYLVGGRVAINGKPCYARILIKRRGN